MELPEGFWMIAISALIGAFAAYLLYLDKKGKKMQETQEGRREYYEKYTPNYVKKKQAKMGLSPLTKKIPKANTRIRMSKKDRRKSKEENNI